MKTDSENCVCSTNFLIEIWQLENLMEKNAYFNVSTFKYTKPR